jgi:hypothetical protein
MNEKQNALAVPEIRCTGKLVKVLDDGSYLTHIHINAGFLSFHSYAVSSRDVSDDKEFLNEYVKRFNLEEVFVGDYKEVCAQILVTANIWDKDKKLSKEQLDYLRSKMGNTDVEKHIEEFGDNFRYLGAKQVIQMKGLTFSHVWNALQVLIYADYYKDEFMAGASWALQIQKLFREKHFLNAERDMLVSKETKKKAGKRGGQSASNKRQKRIETMLSEMETLVSENPALKRKTAKQLLADLAIEAAVKSNSKLWSQGKDQRDNYLSAMKTDEPFKERFEALGLK